VDAAVAAAAAGGAAVVAAPVAAAAAASRGDVAASAELRLLAALFAHVDLMAGLTSVNPAITYFMTIASEAECVVLCCA
jgi:hypothetical protein